MQLAVAALALVIAAGALAPAVILGLVAADEAVQLSFAEGSHR